MPEGIFIAIEGGDGAGKTTQCARVVKALRHLGHQPILTQEPGGTMLGQMIRRMLLDPETGTVASRAEALLYAADRAQHAGMIVPLLELGMTVVTDRFMDSTLAYQGYGRGEDIEELRGLSLWASDGLVPDLTFVLDIDPADGAGRRKAPADRIEAEGRDFHQAVRDGFLDLASRDPEGHVVIDASLPVEQVTALIVDHVARRLPAPVQDRPLPPAGWPSTAAEGAPVYTGADMRWFALGGQAHRGKRGTILDIMIQEGQHPDLKHLAQRMPWDGEVPGPPGAP